MRPYEIMIILDPEVDERQVTTSLETLPRCHQERQGHHRQRRSLVGVGWLTRSRRRPSYSYVVVNFTAEPATALEEEFTVSSG